MAETPETPTPSLAARIDVFLAAPGVSDATSDDLLRAAAAQLRQLDRIKAALPDRRELIGVVEHLETAYKVTKTHGLSLWMVQVLRRLADALEADHG